MKKYLCPYCGQEIKIYIGDKCGSEPNGSVSINHVCFTGLSIEFFELGQDTTNAEKALQRVGE